MAFRKRNNARMDDFSVPNPVSGDDLPPILDTMDNDINAVEDDNPGIDRPIVQDISRFQSSQKRNFGNTSKHNIPGSMRPEKPTMPTWLKRTVTWFICILLIIIFVVMILARIVTDPKLQPILEQPEGAIAKVVTPVQTVFANITDSVVAYLRKLKLRSSLELEINNVGQRNEVLENENMQLEEYQIRISQLEDILGEVTPNQAMNPIACSVIGRDEGSYFSAFQINKGLNDGIEDLMAVTTSGALIGYTYNTKADTADVISIISSEASIPAIIQSSRDQGTIRGTLGINGEPMCRMYYLPDNTVPRPGDTVVTSNIGIAFPKGIPIGTVRESTRGLENNKQYIVVEPLVDFQRIEYVIVYGYKPEPEAIQGNTGSAALDFVPIETARPVPTFNIVGGDSSFYGTASPAPEDVDEETTPAPSSSPAPSESPEPIQPPQPGATIDANATNAPDIQYQAPNASAEPTIIPTPEPSPAPTPEVTFEPGDYTVEDD